MYDKIHYKLKKKGKKKENKQTNKKTLLQPEKDSRICETNSY